MSKACTLAAVLLSGGLKMLAQGPAGPPKMELPNVFFDVSTIKPTQIDNDMMSVSWSEGKYTAKNVSVISLIEQAYGVRNDLISGLPGWAKSDHYDIVAKSTDLDPSTLKGLSRDQQRELMKNMMRQLVEERFHVKTHTEVKQLSVYDLVVAKSGIKFKSAGLKPGAPGCKGWMSSSGANMKMECVPFEMLATNLEYRVQRTIVDKTGLPKDVGYDMDLKWRRETEGAASDTDLQLPTLFDALQEQLGLKLESSKGPVKTLVVDQLDKPTEN